MTNIVPKRKIPQIRNSAFLNSFGDSFELNAVAIVYVSRRSDDLFWNGSAWMNNRVSNAMIKIGDTIQPGVWKFDLPLVAVTGEADSVYDFYIEETSGLSINPIQHLSIEIGGAENTLNLLRMHGFNRMFHDKADNKLKLHDDNGNVIAESQVLNVDEDVLEPINFGPVTPVERTKATLL